MSEKTMRQFVADITALPVRIVAIIMYDRSLVPTRNCDR